MGNKQQMAWSHVKTPLTWLLAAARRMNMRAMADMPRQEGELPQLATTQNGPAATNFSEWLKQTIEKRNGK